jgi:hypothetical protein
MHILNLKDPDSSPQESGFSVVGGTLRVTDMARPTPPAKAKSTGIWLPLGLLLVSVYLFWVLPYQRGPQKVRVEFSNPAPAKP